MAVIHECDVCGAHHYETDDTPRPLTDVRCTKHYENRHAWSFSMCPECAKVIMDASQVKMFIRQVRAQHAATEKQDMDWLYDAFDAVVAEGSQGVSDVQAACEHEWNYGMHHKECKKCGLQEARTSSGV